MASSPWHRRSRLAVTVIGLSLLLLVVLVVVVAIGGVTASVTTSSRKNLEVGEERPPAVAVVPVLRNLQQVEDTCENQCTNPKFHDVEVYGQDMVDPAILLARLRSQRNEWVTQKLYKDYGQEHYENIFMPLTEVYDAVTNTTQPPARVSIGMAADGYPDPIFQDPAKMKLTKNGSKNRTKPAVAWNYLIRKWQIKLLQIQINVLEERKNVKPICLESCATKQQQQDGGSTGNNNKDGRYGKFVWATGGHRYV